MTRAMVGTRAGVIVTPAGPAPKIVGAGKPDRRVTMILPLEPEAFFVGRRNTEARRWIGVEPRAAGGSVHVFVAPVVPGKEEEWRRFFQEVAEAPAEYERLREHLGVRRELVWLVPSARGYATMVYLEIDGDLDEFVRRLAAMDEAFDLWFKERIVECHGRGRSGSMASLPASTLDPIFSWAGGSGERR